MIPEKATRSFMLEDYVVITRHGQVLLKNFWTNPSGRCHADFWIQSSDPGVAMRFFALLITFGLLTSCTLAAQTPGQEPAKPAAKAASPEQIETERIKVPESLQAPPRSMASQPGYMEPAQTHQLLSKLWQAEARVKDLTTQIRPDQLKMPAVEIANFNNTLNALRGSLASLDQSRQMFDSRPDSEYLGFETYAGISEVLPQLERLSRTASRYNNPSLEGEFNQSWNDLLTMRQSLKPYLSFLLRNHDQIFLTMETNLAGCQNELGYKNYKTDSSPTNLRNVLPDFKGRRVRKKPGNSEPASQGKP